jgi:hypothetical protein
MNLQSEDKQLKLMHQWNKQKNIKIQQNPVYIAESDEKMFAGNWSTHQKELNTPIELLELSYKYTTDL